MALRMATVTTQLRELILAGELDPGARLIEIPLANANLNVALRRVES
jgi:DNA-binding GntR family transcriptional regulator